MRRKLEQYKSFQKKKFNLFKKKKKLKVVIYFKKTVAQKCSKVQFYSNITENSLDTPIKDRRSHSQSWT